MIQHWRVSVCSSTAKFPHLHPLRMKEQVKYNGKGFLFQVFELCQLTPRTNLGNNILFKAHPSSVICVLLFPKWNIPSVE